MLSREVILEAGLELVDGGGAAALTMRALAQRLDVTATAIYYYFDGRDDLLEAVIDRVCESIVESAPDQGSWDERLRTLLEALVIEGLEHRAVLALTITEYGKRHPVLRISESILGILRDAGFSLESAVYVNGAVLRFCIGHLMTGQVAAGLDWRELPDAEFPNYRAAGAIHDSFDRSREFRLGLDALLRGIADGPLAPAGDAS
jgi:TetR/AcrR family transcriptional regulator, tetracycline repressor protein